MNKKKDIRMILKAFTWKRFINVIIITASYLISLVIKKPIVWGYAPVIMIEPTNICNLKCPLCPSGTDQLTREKGFMSFELFKTIIDQVYKHSFMLLLWNQGEPFLNPDFIKMIEYANSKKMFLMTSTNANKLPNSEEIVKSGLDYMIVSFDGATQDTYNKYRVNGSLETLINNVKSIVKTKKKLNSIYPTLVCQCLAMKHNEHEIEKIKKFSDDLGFDMFVLKNLQIYSKEDIINFLPENPKYRRYKVTGDDFELKYGLKNRCQRIWSQPVINWKGDVSVCCFDKDINYKLGNINNNTFMEIWKSDKFMSFRRIILKNRSHFDICRNCGEGVSLKIKNK